MDMRPPGVSAAQTRRFNVRLFRFLPIAVVVACTALGLVLADTKIVEKHHADAVEIMGQTQPARDQEVTIWIGTDKMRTDSGNSSVITRLDTQKLYIVDHTQKRVLTADLPIDFKALAGEMAAMIEPMLEKMAASATVTPTEERKQVGQWNARRYDVDVSSAMMNMAIEMWVSQEIPVDRDNAMKLAATLQQMQPGMKDLVKKMSQIEGYPVKQIFTVEVMGATQKQVQEVISAEEGDAPAGTYEPPADYPQSPLTFQEMQGMNQ